MLASTKFDLESCTPTFKNIKLLTSFACSLKVGTSVPLYSAYLLLTSSMNSKLNFPTLLLILHLVYNTMGQHKSGLVVYCTLMTSRSCPLALRELTSRSCPHTFGTTEAIRRTAHGQSVTQTVSYSLRYDKKRSQLTPTQNLGGNRLCYLVSYILLLCSRLLTSHSPSATSTPLPLTTTSRTHSTNSTLTPS